MQMHRMIENSTHFQNILIFEKYNFHGSNFLKTPCPDSAFRRHIKTSLIRWLKELVDYIRGQIDVALSVILPDKMINIQTSKESNSMCIKA